MLNLSMPLAARAGLVAAAGVISSALVVEAASTVGSFSHMLERPWNEILTPHGIATIAKDFWDLIGPGGKLHPAYFLEHKGHLVVEGLLLLLILYLLFQKRAKVQPSDGALTDKEIEMLCKEWQPEPLVPAIPKDDVLPEAVVISEMDGTYATVNGQRVINLATCNFLGMTTEADLKANGKATIDKYGVGSCGPRGFYGTIDVHLELEKQLREFMKVDAGIIYSYDIATVASVIPAFVNRRDVIIMDEACSYPIQSGCTVSRAKLITYKHNDMADLEKHLKQIDAEEKANPRKPLARKFIVAEGIYANIGDLAPIDKLVELKEKYRWRLLIEESYSFGVLGATGRGITEHFGIAASRVEMICGSMGTALGSVGGWCVGEGQLIDHQRLSGLGYCFSASLPPYLATAASHVLGRLEAAPRELLPKLQAAASAMRRELKKVSGFKVAGSDDISPVIHLHLAAPSGNYAKDIAACQAVADHMAAQGGVLVSVPRFSRLEARRPAPGLRINVNVLVGDKEVAATVAALKKAVKEVL